MQLSSPTTPNTSPPMQISAIASISESPVPQCSPSSRSAVNEIHWYLPEYSSEKNNFTIFRRTSNTINMTIRNMSSSCLLALLPYNWYCPIVKAAIQNSYTTALLTSKLWAWQHWFWKDIDRLVDLVFQDDKLREKILNRFLRSLHQQCQYLCQKITSAQFCWKLAVQICTFSSDSILQGWEEHALFFATFLTNSNQYIWN